MSCGGARARQLSRVHVTVANARITVTDNGPRIRPEPANAHCFQRLRGAAGGTGLGTPIVHWITQAHDGTIAVRNTGTGARFEVALIPAQADPD